PQAMVQKAATARERPSPVAAQVLGHQAQPRVALRTERACEAQPSNNARRQLGGLRRPPVSPRNSGGASRPEALPEVLVDKNEAESLAKLYESIQSGRVDIASIAAVPPGFERKPDGSLAPAPIKIPPLEIAKLDSGEV